MLILGTAGAALLSIDNLLGFVGTHAIDTAFVPMIAAVSVLAGSVAAVGGVLARDITRVFVAVAVVGFVATRSPATGIHLWFPIAVALQALVPLAFAAAGALVLHRHRELVIVRVVAALLVGFALAWTATAFIPVALAAFLIVQAGTLLVVVILSLRPVFRLSWSLARELWSSADVR
ncbi:MULTISPECIES: hypothetical protein [unclassified Curtobacterium]|uniref:hypothetical protein n=1 Tax=unclassified Curtobacterium TaxID=257496 RepID=UPI000DA72E80|nr:MULTISPECIES: hypothetical protein [unclassified Curtobacterium]PZE34779.1 hypothetical protein DEJ31_14205 [Curtobacterium sp. MCPF17_031]PZF13772.1 hypothetical protein DEJ25_04585 [Curtobacterium sp. MCPF17_011]